MFSVYGNQVLKTDDNGIKCFYSWSNRAKIEMNKTKLTVGEEIPVSLTWEKFNIDSGDYEIDRDNVSDFQVLIYGQRQTIPFADAGFIFVANDSGRFGITTVIPNTQADSIEVEVL